MKQLQNVSNITVSVENGRMIIKHELQDPGREYIQKPAVIPTKPLADAIQNRLTSCLSSLHDAFMEDRIVKITDYSIIYKLKDSEKIHHFSVSAQNAMKEFLDQLERTSESYLDAKQLTQISTEVLLQCIKAVEDLPMEAVPNRRFILDVLHEAYAMALVKHGL